MVNNIFNKFKNYNKLLLHTKKKENLDLAIIL